MKKTFSIGLLALVLVGLLSACAHDGCCKDRCMNKDNKAVVTPSSSK